MTQERKPQIDEPKNFLPGNVVSKYVSDQVSWSDGLKNQLDNLMAEKPNCVTWQKMGFIEDWKLTFLWTRAVNPPPQI